MSNYNLEIKEIINQLLKSMDLEGYAELDEQDKKVLRVNIQSPEAAFLIGRGGENLKALQQLSRVLVGKKIKEPVSFILDVNDYQAGKTAMIKEMAEQAIKEIKEQGGVRWLPAMNAYERRVVHLIVAQTPGVASESEGDGEARRVKIKPTE